MATLWEADVTILRMNYTLPGCLYVVLLFSGRLSFRCWPTPRKLLFAFPLGLVALGALWSPSQNIRRVEELPKR